MPHLVEILLPLTKTLTREKLDTICAELTDRFGGATFIQMLRQRVCGAMTATSSGTALSLSKS
ncbi:hypothetical protein [Rhizobium sp.]|uniref:hypothetical protein n=1 Tax=Rhizobium sp. TaxID=391 RepID=UPI0028AA9452